MDIKQLEVFVKVAKFKSFTKAAEELNLSQPTVSLHIQNLEKELGVKLFDREGRRATLTPPGKALYKYALEIVKLRRKALLIVKETLGKIEGEFTVGASTVPGEYILPKVLTKFVSEYPATKFQIRILDSEAIINEVFSENLEIGFVGSKKETDKLEFIPFLKDEIIIARSPQLKAIRDIDELMRAPLILRERGSGTRKIFEERLNRMGINPKDLNVITELGSTTAVKEAIKNGLGYGVISLLAVKEELKDNKLFKNEIPGLNISRDFYIVKRKQKTLSPAIKLFSEFVTQQEWHA